MWNDLVSGHEASFLTRLVVALICGVGIGLEREARGKPAGVSTHCFVISGAMVFTFVSIALDTNSPGRIAAQIVSGIGFLGAGMILKSEGGTVTNLTTAAGIWFAGAIGMVIGVGWYALAGCVAVCAVLVPRIPHVSKKTKGLYE